MDASPCAPRRLEADASLHCQPEEHAKEFPMRVKSKRKPAKKPAKAPDVRVGAASALTRLEAEEACLFGAYETAKAGGDALEIKIARDAWIKVSESLRRFDLMLEAARRETGELVPRADVEQWLENVGICLHWALLKAVTTDKSDLQKAWSTCDGAFAATVHNHDPKRSAPCTEVPEWMYLALFRQRTGGHEPGPLLNHYRKTSAVVAAFELYPNDPEKIEAYLRAEFKSFDATPKPKRKTPDA